MSAKIAVIVFSLYGHVAKLSESIVEGAKSTGAQVDVYQFPETLSDEVLAKMHANKAPIKDLPVITPNDLKNYDGFILGFPTRYGRAPAQVSAFFDQTGGLWASGALIGKFASTFTSTASQHGGLETTHLTTIPFFVHHGINYVPIGYRKFGEQTNLTDVVGPSAYGAGTVAGGDGSRQPVEADLIVAKDQGEHFATVVNTFVKGKSA
ncbi:putative 1,4-benzoquinone reductase [Testicularia cyperi]|uniref:Putative 1,4-benzoquinone reductase n=1 Tax=Testicularia cyperi TaxID=1882483 RepID=A0A317XRX2_9BASI|nr:putative 1,4-benzoquinone reductase [Testicularia cyperi]